MQKRLNWQRFIEFWSQFYNDTIHSDEKFYNPYINDLSKDDFLDKLWRWKMGVYFKSRNNQKALGLMRENIENIRNFRKSNPAFSKLYEFSEKIFKSGIIYRIFLIHICRPDDYPIFDQHVFRAFIFITTRKLIDTSQRTEDYLDYRKFVLKINKQYGITLRDTDKALMAFGQFLSNPQKFLKSNRPTKI